MAFLSRTLRSSRKYMDYDYARHMPKAYVDKAKRTVPKKVYDNRFGAPKIVKWRLHANEHAVSAAELGFEERNRKDKLKARAFERPWEKNRSEYLDSRQRDYNASVLHTKFYELPLPHEPPIPGEKFTFMVGDRVQAMVGPSKGQIGVVTAVVKDRGWVLVERLHRKVVKIPGNKAVGMSERDMDLEQLLDIATGEVKLIDPSDEQPCEAEWVENVDKWAPAEGIRPESYIRRSIRSGYVIPIPRRASVTYEYTNASSYIESPKDTTWANVSDETYDARLTSFEDDVMKSMGIVEERTHKPTYWY